MNNESKFQNRFPKPQSIKDLSWIGFSEHFSMIEHSPQQNLLHENLELCEKYLHADY